MSLHSLTRSAVFTDPVPVPTDGDYITADRDNAGDSPVNQALQALSNDDLYMRASAEMGLSLSLLPSVQMFITATSITVTPLGNIALWADQGTTSCWAQHTGSTIAVTGLTTGAWYYIYLYYSGGSVAYEIGTTAPAATFGFKTGDLTRRYIGCAFVYDAGGGTPNFIAARQNGRYTALATTGPALSGLPINGTGAWVGPASLSGSSFVPPHARMVEIYAEFTWTGNATASLQVRPHSIGGGLIVATAPETVGAVSGGNVTGSAISDFVATACGRVTLCLDASQQFDWQLPNSTNASLTVFAPVGFYQ